MLEYLPPEIRDALDTAARRSGPPRRRLAVHIQDAVFPVRRLWPGGFAIGADRLGRLRGRVEVWEGARPLMAGLIVATEIVGDELICQFKSVTLIGDQPPAPDYERRGPPLAGLIGRH